MSDTPGVEVGRRPYGEQHRAADALELLASHLNGHGYVPPHVHDAERRGYADGLKKAVLLARDHDCGDEHDSCIDSLARKMEHELATITEASAKSTTGLVEHLREPGPKP